MARFPRHLPAYLRPVLLLGLAVFAAGAVVIEGLTGFVGVIIVVAGIVTHLDPIGLFTRPERGVSTPT